jgi:hypothetical protein
VGQVAGSCEQRGKEIAFQVENHLIWYMAVSCSIRTLLHKVSLSSEEFRHNIEYANMANTYYVADSL